MYGNKKYFESFDCEKMSDVQNWKCHEVLIKKKLTRTRLKTVKYVIYGIHYIEMFFGVILQKKWFIISLKFFVSITVILFENLKDDDQTSHGYVLFFRPKTGGTKTNYHHYYLTGLLRIIINYKLLFNH